MGPAESWPLLLPLELERAFLVSGERKRPGGSWALGLELGAGREAGAHSCLASE